MLLTMRSAHPKPRARTTRTGCLLPRSLCCKNLHCQGCMHAAMMTVCSATCSSLMYSQQKLMATLLSSREETLEFAVGGDFVDREGELIEVEVWDYHWYPWSPHAHCKPCNLGCIRSPCDLGAC